MISRDELTKQLGLAHAFASEIRALAESIATRLQRSENRVKAGWAIGDLESPGCSDIAERMTRLVRCEGRIEVMMHQLYQEEDAKVPEAARNHDGWTPGVER